MALAAWNEFGLERWLWTILPERSGGAGALHVDFEAGTGMHDRLQNTR